MAAKQTVRKTVTQTTTVKRAARGLASLPTSTNQTVKAAVKAGGSKRGRPVGAKDTKPRKPRSDKGKKRGSYKPREVKA